MTLAINKDGIKGLLKTVETAFKRLHKNGKYAPEDLAKTKAYKDLVTQTSTIFNGAITDNDIPEAMAKSLKEDVFIFSGLKTHAQLAEAAQLLKTADGKVKSFSAFAKDVETIKTNYNQNYLEAEYQFAVSSAQSAGNWANISDDYNLQYRTAGDDRVRDSHDALRDTTLPKDDAFWLSYYPPNGWRCRCTAVQVRKSKYETSDSTKAIAEGEKATKQIGKDGKNKLEIFRFNPGIQKVVFPPTHPYSKVAGAQKVRKELKASLEQTNDKFLPEDLKTFLNNEKITIDPKFFNLFKKEVGFEFYKSNYYKPKQNKVVLRKDTNPYHMKRVIYHEFGHALDEHNDFYKSKKTLDVMNKYIKQYGYDGLKALDDSARKLSREDGSDISAIRDTVMSLNTNLGAGHTKAYFREQGAFNRQREFLAHAFENKFLGNEGFKKVAPELYNDMIKLIDDLTSGL